ncbi:MAG: hypothetical protein AAF160_10635 [Pseudomonadota bacterium]
MVDQQKLVALFNLLEARAKDVYGDPLMTVAEFFDGNDQDYSFAANVEKPPLSEIQAMLERVETADGVSAVRLVSTHLNERDYCIEVGDWPYTDTVLVVASLEEKQVSQLFDVLEPDDIWVGTEERYVGLPPIPSGAQLYNVWWD